MHLAAMASGEEAEVMDEVPEDQCQTLLTLPLSRLRQPFPNIKYEQYPPGDYEETPVNN